MSLYKEVSIQFIRNFTIEPVEFFLNRELNPSQISANCFFGGFSTTGEELVCLKNNSQPFDLLVLALGLEMSDAEFGHLSWAVESACDRHLMFVETAISNSIKPVVINTVLPPLYSATGLTIVPGLVSHSERVDRLNTELRALARAHPGRAILTDWTQIARELGEKDTYDYRFWYSSGAPFASRFLQRYAAGIASVIRSVTGKSRKCLVLDCDNTLWHGVIGEDGREAIGLSSNTVPGAYFLEFQRSILDLYRRGVIIALCSKNNEAEVLDVIDNHPECLIRREHIAAWRINWNEKAQSIAELAAELNIGIEAMVFVDDSAHECELMRAIHPSLLVKQIPNQPERLVGFLAREHLFDAMVVTDEDVIRSRTYQQNRARSDFSGSFKDLSEYKKKLGTRLSVRPAHRVDIPRIFQLIQRTNQFNLTTRRYEQTALECMLEEHDVIVLCAELEDRFGKLGLIGVAIARRAQTQNEVAIDSMLMSCRALGRDAEIAFAASLFSALAKKWQAERIVAEYVETLKNSQVADFWLRLGLVRDTSASEQPGSQRFCFTGDLIALSARIMPAHVELTESGDGQ